MLSVDYGSRSILFARGKGGNDEEASKAKQARQGRPENAEKSEERAEKTGQVVS